MVDVNNQPGKSMDEEQIEKAWQEYCDSPDSGVYAHGLSFYAGYKAAVADIASGKPVAWIEHHKGGDNLVWERTSERCTPLTYAASAPDSVVVPREPTAIGATA